MRRLEDALVRLLDQWEAYWIWLSTFKAVLLVTILGLLSLYALGFTALVYAPSLVTEPTQTIIPTVTSTPTATATPAVTSTLAPRSPTATLPPTPTQLILPTATYPPTATNTPSVFADGGSDRNAGNRGPNDGNAITGSNAGNGHSTNWHTASHLPHFE